MLSWCLVVPPFLARKNMNSDNDNNCVFQRNKQTRDDEDNDNGDDGKKKQLGLAELQCVCSQATGRLTGTQH